MFKSGSYDGDELDFDPDDDPEGLAGDPLSFPLDAVLLAWSLAHSSGPIPDGEDFDQISRQALVVDDDRISRKAIGRFLESQGWTVAEAATLTEGIDGLNPPPACLALDLMLPDGDGADLLRLVRAGGLPTRVVVATGSSDPAVLDTIAGLSPESLHIKPVDLQAFYRDCLG